MKFAHNSYFAKYKAQLDNPMLNFYWTGGLLITTVGSIIYIPALSYGNQILLASSCSLSIIFNLFFALTILKERILPSDMLGIFMICIGSILFLYCAKNEAEAKHYVEKDIPWLITRPVTIIFCSISLIYFILS
jgi:drug/metabolite transporter (DMT)-like permease